jgi:hypothetical protein
MSVIARKFKANPVRTAAETWTTIVNVIAKKNDSAKNLLLRITGVAASIIAEGIPATSPITIIGSGPRLRVYCLYDDDAIEEDGNEDSLSWNPFDSEWDIYFPVNEVDMEWVNNMLSETGKNFHAYLAGEKIEREKENAASQMPPLTINLHKLKSHA